MNNHKQVVWAEVLRTIAVLGVILMHISDSFMTTALDGSNNISVIAGTFFTCVGSFCVPVFFMLTGAFMLDKKSEPYSQFLWKRFIKAVLPLFFWILLYALFNKFYMHADIEVFSWWISNYNNGSGSYHLWFMFEIICLYTLIPVYRLFISAAEEKDILYFLIVWYVLVFFVPVLRLHFNINLGIKDAYWTHPAGYVVLGYYLRKFVIVKKIGLLAWGFIFSVLIQSLIYYYSDVNGSLRAYENDIGLLQPIKSACIFLCIMAIYEQYPYATSRFDRFFSGLGSKAYGIYLVHIIILTMSGNNPFGVLFPQDQYGPVGYILLNTLLIYFGSLVVIYLFSKNPLLKFLVP